MKKIENFMLPEHTNELYTKEAISSISLTRDVAEKINELVAAYNELFEEDLLWKHEQEGRIRKGVLYMKDHLINSLNELMQLVGNSIIDERVTYYVKDLTTRVNNLLGNSSEYSEVTDMRVGADGKVYPFAGDAIRAQLKDISDQIDRLYAETNVLTVDLALPGYIAYGGVVNETDQAKRTGRIPCSAFQYVKYSTSISNAGYEVAFFDKNGSVILDQCVLGSTAAAEDKIIEISGAAYLEVSCYGSANYDSFSCILYNEGNLSSRVPETFSEIFSKDAALTLPGYIAIGGVVSESATAKRTGRIPCKNYRFLKYGTSISSAGYEVAFYDEKGTFLPNVSILGVNSFVNKVIDLEGLGAAYLEISCYGLTNSKNAYAILYNSNEEGVTTKHKQALIFGDSITVTATISNDGSTYTEDTDTSWLTYARDMLQLGNHKNYACSGARWCNFSGSNFYQQLSNQINTAISVNDVNPDIIIISIGTNDLAASDSFDEAMAITSIENLDKTKLFQAIRWAMWTLKKKYPAAACYVATPIQRAAREAFPSVLEAIRKMGERYNFIVMDAYKESGIIRENEVSGGSGVYLKDGLHPNTAGDLKLAKYYANIINQTFTS